MQLLHTSNWIRCSQTVQRSIWTLNCPLVSFLDPVGPTRLDVQLDPVQTQYKRLSVVQIGSSGLRVSWSRSAGHVDWYDVTLEDSSSGSTRSTRIMGTAAPQSGFSSLVPGTLYTVSVVATAGNKSAPPVRTTAATGEELVNYNTWLLFATNLLWFVPSWTNRPCCILRPLSHLYFQISFTPVVLGLFHTCCFRSLSHL